MWRIQLSTHVDSFIHCLIRSATQRIHSSTIKIHFFTSRMRRPCYENSFAINRNSLSTHRIHRPAHYKKLEKWNMFLMIKNVFENETIFATEKRSEDENIFKKWKMFSRGIGFEKCKSSWKWLACLGMKNVVVNWKSWE